MTHKEIDRQLWVLLEVRVHDQIRSWVRNRVELQVGAQARQADSLNRVWYAVGGEIWHRSYPVKEQIELQAKEATDD